jgi:hypothetical protein
MGCIIYGAPMIADKFAETFNGSPIIRKANSFTIGDAVAKMKQVMAGG